MDNESETLVVPAEEELEKYFTLKFGRKQVESGMMIYGLAIELSEAKDSCWRKGCDGTQSAGLLEEEDEDFTVHVPVRQDNLKQTYLNWKMKCDKCGSIRVLRRDRIRWIWENGEPFVLCDDGDSLHWTAK
tara:strand:- start:276 stop:668 length:393 start_codon:yes stop_codon:yes gene_type:complete